MEINLIVVVLISGDDIQVAVAIQIGKYKIPGSICFSHITDVASRAGEEGGRAVIQVKQVVGAVVTTDDVQVTILVDIADSERLSRERAEWEATATREERQRLAELYARTLHPSEEAYQRHKREEEKRRQAEATADATPWPVDPSPPPRVPP